MMNIKIIRTVSIALMLCRDICFSSMLQLADYLSTCGFCLARVYATYRKNAGATEH